MRLRTRVGGSLAELLVALALFAIGGSLATRLLLQAGLEVERAELGLRAALLLVEMHAETPESGTRELVRPAGPGILVSDPLDETGILRVRFEPPGDGGPESGAGAGGFRRPRSWTLGGEP